MKPLNNNKYLLIMKQINQRKKKQPRPTPQNSATMRLKKINSKPIIKALFPLLMLINNSLADFDNPVLSFQTHTNEITSICARLSAYGNGGELIFGGWIRTPTTQFLVSDLQGFTSGFGEASRTTLPLNTNSNCRRFSKDTWLFVGARLHKKAKANCGGGGNCCLTFHKVLLSQGKKESTACTNSDTPVSDVVGVGHSFTYIKTNTHKVGITTKNIVSTIKGFSSFFSDDKNNFLVTYIYGLAAGEPQIHNVTDFSLLNSPAMDGWIFTDEASRKSAFDKLNWRGYLHDLSQEIGFKLGTDVIVPDVFCWALTFDFNVYSSDEIIKVGDSVGTELQIRINPTASWITFRILLTRLSLDSNRRVRMQLYINNGASTMDSYLGYVGDTFLAGGDMNYFFNFGFCPYLDQSLAVSAAVWTRERSQMVVFSDVGKFFVPSTPSHSYTEDVRPEFKHKFYSSVANPTGIYNYLKRLAITKGGMSTPLLGMNDPGRIHPEPMLNTRHLYLGIGSPKTTLCHTFNLLDSSAAELGLACKAQSPMANCFFQEHDDVCTLCNGGYFQDRIFKAVGCKATSSECVGPNFNRYS